MVHPNGSPVDNFTSEDSLHKGRTLCLFFDGTDECYDGCNTNVVHIFSLLKKDDPSRQLVYYQAGIGTYVAGPEIITKTARWLAMKVDQAFAYSIDSHVMSGYRFLMENWEEGDRICLFGFSRGAYTARALAGMLYQVGLLPKGMHEEVSFAYNIYRHKKASAVYKRDFSRTVSIEFIGVFDTVSAVGALIPRTLPFSADNHITRTFRHAISLDENRAAFIPQPWERTVDPPETAPEPEHQSDEAAREGGLGQKHVGIVRTGVAQVAKAVKKRFVGSGSASKIIHRAVAPSPQGGPSTDVKEVYFAGCHTDIGGGTDLNGTRYCLAQIPLRWMIKEILIAPAGAGIVWNEDDPRFAELGIIIHPGPGSSITVSDARESKGSRIIGECNHSRSETLHHMKDVSNTATLAEPQFKGTYAEPDDAPSPCLPVDARAEDVVAPMNDALKTEPGWWIVEFLPFITSTQDENDRWRNHIRINLFRGRRIGPPPSPAFSQNARDSPNGRGANISPASSLWHVSVRERMQASATELHAAAVARKAHDYELKHGKGRRVSWRWSVERKHKKYVPRAKLEGGGEPVFVR